MGKTPFITEKCKKCGKEYYYISEHTPEGICWGCAEEDIEVPCGYCFFPTRKGGLIRVELRTPEKKNGEWVWEGFDKLICSKCREYLKGLFRKKVELQEGEKK